MIFRHASRPVVCGMNESRTVHSVVLVMWGVLATQNIPSHSRSTQASFPSWTHSCTVIFGTPAHSARPVDGLTQKAPHRPFSTGKGSLGISTDKDDKEVYNVDLSAPILSQGVSLHNRSRTLNVNCQKGNQSVVSSLSRKMSLDKCSIAVIHSTSVHRFVVVRRSSASRCVV